MLSLPSQQQNSSLLEDKPEGENLLIGNILILQRSDVNTPQLLYSPFVLIVLVAIQRKLSEGRI